MVAAITPITVADCTIDASEGFDKIYDLLQLRGGIVVKNLIPKEDALQVKADLEPELQAQRDAIRGKWEGEWFPPTTVKVAGMLTKSETFANKIALNPTFLHLADVILTQRNKLHVGEKKMWCSSYPTVNTTSILEIHPGAKAQTLHRDDIVFHNILPEADKWTRERELSILCFVGLSKITPENGGTLFIPGSHLWGHEREVPPRSEALSCEMDVGDSFIMLCSTFHGGGANVMPPGEETSIRCLSSVGYTRGYLRPEEPPHLTYKLEDVKKLAPKLQEMCGYSVSRPALGAYNFGDPRNLLGYDIPATDDLMWDPIQED